MIPRWAWAAIPASYLAAAVFGYWLADPKPCKATVASIEATDPHNVYWGASYHSFEGIECTDAGGGWVKCRNAN